MPEGAMAALAAEGAKGNVVVAARRKCAWEWEKEAT